MKIKGQVFSEIKKGLVVFVCIERGDEEDAISWMAEKIASIRIFPDETGKFNKNIKDVGGEVLVISNFTLCGELKKGTRPSFHLAEEPTLAQNKLATFVQMLKEKGLIV
ncbi:MAG: D-aminoacyl-tRNA deacylase, partial [Caldimicrobium sp.]